MIINQPQKQKNGKSRQQHPFCVVCSRNNPVGLHLQFKPSGIDQVEGEFFCNKMLEGYPGRLHGGVIASLLDGAMTNCLFLGGYTAVTVDLNVRYKHPVETGKTATVRGWIDRKAPLLYCLKAELIQSNEVKATAQGKFMDLPRPMKEEESYADL